MKTAKRITFILMLLSGIMTIYCFLVTPIMALILIAQIGTPEAFSLQDTGELLSAGSIAVIGGADGPTAIYTTSILAPPVYIIPIVFVFALVVWLVLRHKIKKASVGDR